MPSEMPVTRSMIKRGDGRIEVLAQGGGPAMVAGHAFGNFVEDIVSSPDQFKSGPVRLRIT